MDYEKSATNLFAARIHTLLTISGLAFLAVALLDIPNGGIWPILRTTISTPLTFIAGGLVFVGILIWIWERRLQLHASSSITDHVINPTDGIGKLEPKLKHGGLSNEQVGSFEGRFLELSATQKLIVLLVYDSFRSEFILNELYDLLSRRRPRIVGSSTELYFRVKDLHNQGILTVEPAGQKTAIVRARPDVAALIEKHGLYPSGNTK